MWVGQMVLKKVEQLVWTMADGKEQRKDFGWVYLRADLLVCAKRSMVERWADELAGLTAADLVAAMAQQ
eukprot:scaffold8858_cov174-Ochromonas_danica.AAC.2